MTTMEAAIDAALRQERLEIATVLWAEAAKHEDAAADLRANYNYREIGDEVEAHESDAALIDRLADLILARTPTAAVDRYEAPLRKIAAWQRYGMPNEYEEGANDMLATLKQIAEEALS